MVTPTCGQTTPRHGRDADVTESARTDQGRYRMTTRQIPKWSELRPLLQPKPIRWNGTDRRLANALTIADLRTVAQAPHPASVFDYTDGAAEAEISLRRARQLFGQLEFQPSILQDVSDVDTTTTILGSAVRAAVRVRADRLHPDDEPRGRAGRRPGGAAPRHPVRAVDDGDHLDRGRRRGRPGRAQVVPALRVEGPRRRRGPDGPRQGRRVRGADAHRRRPGRRCPAARRPQRLLHPAGADRQDRARRRDPPGVVDEPADHRAADLRVAVHLERHRRRPAGQAVRPDDDARRPGVDPRVLGRAADHQGHPDRRRRASGRRRRRRRDRAVQPRRPPARPRAGAAAPAARRRRARSATAPRSGSTPAS